MMDITTIEDLILEHWNNPSKIQIELRNNLKPEDWENWTKDEIFGDERVTQMVKDAVSGKPMDMAYIQAQNFSETGTTPQSETPEVILAQNLKNSPMNFKKILVDPMFVTDWVSNKHQMVGEFEFPEIPQDEIAHTLDMTHVCDPTTVSMLTHLRNEIPSIPEFETDEELAEFLKKNPQTYATIVDDFKQLKGPSLDEYLTDFGTTLQPEITEGLTSDNSCYYSLAKSQLEQRTQKSTDFSVDLTRFKTLRGLLYGIRQGSNPVTALEQIADLSETAGQSVTPITPEQVSETILFTGEAEGNEKYLIPKHLHCWNRMKKDGISEFVEPSETDERTPEQMIVVIKATPDDKKLDVLKSYRSNCVKPGDFFRVYEEFAEVSNNIAKVLSNNNKPEVKLNVPQYPKTKISEIPTGDTVSRKPNQGSSAPKSQS